MPRTGHVALTGLPNVGKSSLLNALLGQHLAIVSPKAQATRIPVVGLLSRDAVQIILHDLPGLLDPSYLMQERMRGLALAALPSMDLILHLHPASAAPAPPFTQVAGLDAPTRAPVLVVYTKGDLVSPASGELLSSEAFVVSSDTGQGVAKLVDAIGARLPEADFEFDPDDVGTQPLRFFVVEYLREAAFELLGDELPYAFTAEVEEFREAERPMYIRATLFVERESQKGMVIGRAGHTIKAIGAHARRRLEELTGNRVYLDLWVKVLPHWRKNPGALARFGFPPSQTERA